jgi:CRISPR-associated protein Csm1
MPSISHQVATSVFRQSLQTLFLPKAPVSVAMPEEHDLLIRRAKELLRCTVSKPAALRCLFDRVELEKRSTQAHFWPAKVIEDNYPTIPYPMAERPDCAYNEVQDELRKLSPQEWEQLPLLMLILEKYASYLSCGDEEVAVVDTVRSVAAVAAVLSVDPAATNFSLIAADISGIQKFIYTISSDGALKSLRARSFYLELVTEELIQQLLLRLDLPRCNIIYAGGGNLYFLAPAGGAIANTVKVVSEQFNEWLYGEFQAKVFLSIDSIEFPIKSVGSEGFSKPWQKVGQKLSTRKSQKFSAQLEKLFTMKSAYEPCKVCHRDDESDLNPLSDEDSTLACSTCRNMYKLGAKLPRCNALVRTKSADCSKSRHTLKFKLFSEEIYYHCLEELPKASSGGDRSETFLIINSWKIESYKNIHAIPLQIGNYAKPSSENEYSFMSAEEMALAAKNQECIPRVGYLRMDVDNLGRIFAEGLKERTLPRIAGLSRQFSYFFKIYLTSLAKNRDENLPKSAIKLTDQPRQNLLFIYAGGDDLFISGTWNEIVEFGNDLYQSFRAYTGYNPNITLSGGITISDEKFPLYRAAKLAGEAEDSAKGNGRDSLTFLNQTFKWSEWLGTIKLDEVEPELSKYIQQEAPDLLGILPFVRQLYFEEKYPRSFLRNLLLTAQIQKRMINAMKEKQKKVKVKDTGQIRDLKYFLHLPKLAYAMARLPPNMLGETFKSMRQSLKSPYNAPYFEAIATWTELLTRERRS